MVRAIVEWEATAGPRASGLLGPMVLSAGIELDGGATSSSSESESLARALLPRAIGDTAIDSERGSRAANVSGLVFTEAWAAVPKRGGRVSGPERAIRRCPPPCTSYRWRPGSICSVSDHDGCGVTEAPLASSSSMFFLKANPRRQ